MTDLQAEHVAHLTSMLRETDWQVERDSGSQWLADQLYQRGARAPFGHSHPVARESRAATDTEEH